MEDNQINIIFYGAAFLFGWFLCALRLKRNQREFAALETAIRDAQKSLVNGFPSEARDHLRAVLPENAESHKQASYVLNHDGK